ncbi:MAG TPA: type II secretion system protein [Candidatus Saccharimonadales bacterium]
MKKYSRTNGFTIIELLVVIVILCILAALVALTASGVQAKNRNNDRQAEIDTIRGQLESYYAGTDKYPTFENLKDSEWRTKNLPRLESDAIDDPRWDKNTTACTTDNKPTVASAPAPNCYSYQVTASDGAPCDNDKTPCAHYTLTATLEGGEKYVKSSLN